MAKVGTRCVFCFFSLLLLAKSAIAMNGMAFAFADHQVISQVINAVGALGYALDTRSEKEAWKVVGNAIYIGSHADGDVLLVPAQAVCSEDVCPDLAKIAKLRIRFGYTVNSEQADFNVPREEFQIPEGTEIVIHPNYVSNKNLKDGAKRYPLALLRLNFKLGQNYKPLAMAGVGAPIAMKSPYKTFGFGSKFDKPDQGDVALTEEQLAETSGYLHWTPVILDSEWKNQSLFKVLPMPDDVYSTLYPKTPREKDAFVDGPCSNDLGAPLVLEGGTLPRPGESAASARRIVLLGVFNAKVGTCEPPKTGVSAQSVYLDLRDPDYVNWLRKYADLP